MDRSLEIRELVYIELSLDSSERILLATTSEVLISSRAASK
jgi:hypothetical protein